MDKRNKPHLPSDKRFASTPRSCHGSQPSPQPPAAKASFASAFKFALATALATGAVDVVKDAVSAALHPDDGRSKSEKQDPRAEDSHRLVEPPVMGYNPLAVGLGAFDYSRDVVSGPTGRFVPFGSVLPRRIPTVAHIGQSDWKDFVAGLDLDDETRALLTRIHHVYLHVSDEPDSPLDPGYLSIEL